jgi:uncharacterized protein
LIIHGDKDNILPVKYADQMFAAAVEPKRIVKLKNSGHNDVLSADLKDYVAALTTFMKGLEVKT